MIRSLLTCHVTTPYDQVADKLAGVVETRTGTKLARPEDLVRLYDIILQNYADLRDIASLDKDGESYQSIDVNTKFYRTKRLVVSTRGLF